MSPVFRALALSIPAMLAATAFGQTKNGEQPAKRIEICTNCPMVGAILPLPHEALDLPLHTPAIGPALLMLPILPLEQQRPDEPLRTTVCEVLENPKRFSDRLLEIRAELVGQSTLLHDPGCPGTLAFDLPEEHSPIKGKDYYKLRRYLEHPGVATATIVGMCGMKGNPHGGTFMCAMQSVRDVRRVKAAK
jgi:hypothetical protein